MANKLLLVFLLTASLKLVSTSRIIPIEFDVVNGDIEELFDLLKVALKDNQQEQDRLDVEGHLVLAPLRRNLADPPEAMIHLKLKGEYKDETTVFIAADNLYVYGFANASGDKFIVQGINNLFPGEHKLDFGYKHSQICNDVKKLHLVPLGRRSMSHAVHAMGWNNPDLGDPDIVRRQAKLGICRILIMVSESLRFFPIRNSFAKQFELESFADEDDLKLVHAWKHASKGLLYWKKTNSWKSNKPMRKVGITDATTGLQKVDVILWVEST